MFALFENSMYSNVIYLTAPCFGADEAARVSWVIEPCFGSIVSLFLSVSAVVATTCRAGRR